MFYYLGCRSWNGIFEVRKMAEVVHNSREVFDVTELVVDIEEVPGHGAGNPVTDCFFDDDRTEAFSHRIFHGVADTRRCGPSGAAKRIVAVGGQKLVKVGAWER